jgi:hypothetical protein
MLIAERRGEYDSSRAKDALVVTDAETDTRAALFLDEDKSLISIAVDMPNKSGALCYSVPFHVLVDVLRARLGV